ncbi:MAG: hypothetical protein HYX50_05155 [Chloroflexi bacterium]|nr:hypothetical protein [Chloroflexota bacterium]
MRSAFVTMAATHGLSIQLLELSGAAAAGPRPDEQPPDEPPERDAGLPEAAAASDSPPATADGEAAPEPPPLDLTPDEWSDTD